VSYAGTSSRLGSFDDPMTDDFADDVGDGTSSTPREAYLAWLAAVKRAGGVVTTMPHINKGAIAARYTVAFVFPHAPATTLNPLFSRPPDDWSTSGDYVYYRAPNAVVAYQYTGAITAPVNVPGETTPGDPVWYSDIKNMLRTGGWIVGGLVVLSALSYLPRRRD